MNPRQFTQRTSFAYNKTTLSSPKALVRMDVIPSRIDMFFSFLTAKFLVVIGGLTQLMGAAVLLLQVPVPYELWNEQRLIAFCAIGSVLGAFLSIAIYPMQGKGFIGGRIILMKFASSSICGIVGAPLLIRWRAWSLDPTTILAVSVGAAFVGVSTLHFAVQFWGKWLAHKGEEILKVRKDE